MDLYHFFRSGTSHRLRIALNLKGLDYQTIAVDLPHSEHLGDAFKAINPQGFVPVLNTDDGVLVQSPAIIEWLEERYPTPALLPQAPAERARVRALAAVVACDIHPLNNRRVLEYLRHDLKCDEDAINTWCGTWIHAGFAALETMLAADKQRGAYCYGKTPTIADVCLIPQIESSRRFKVDLTPYPILRSIEEACNQLAAFQQAAPAQHTLSK